MNTVHLARGLTFPAAELATEVVASLGMRGSGKSNGAAVIAEELLEAKIQIVVLDYVGIWFSLRLAADGKHAAYDIPVLGGPHGDITLVASTGTMVADALARSGSSAVLDLSSFSKGDRCRFATDFAEAFFAAKKTNPGPVQILLEEAQRFVPQKLFAGQGMERMLGAFEEIAEVGRNYGIGLHLISQRPQKINKDVLNLADTVLAYRTNGVLERKAIAEWVQEKEAEGRDDVKGELPGLPRGTALVWSPSREVYGPFAVEKKTTYDAGATPIHARAAVKTKPLDLKELEAVMGEAVETAKANDPRALKARIAELERELAKKLSVAPTKAAKTVEKSVLRDKDVSRLEKLISRVEKNETALIGQIAGLAEKVSAPDGPRHKLIGAVAALTDAMHAHKHSSAPNPLPVNASRAVVPSNGIVRVTTRPKRFETKLPDGMPALSRCARSLLAVLAQRVTATDSQISALSGYRKTSSSFANGLSELRTKGLIDGSPDRRTITQAGREAAGAVEELPKGKELLDYWLRRLSKAEATLLKVIYEHRTISREPLAELADYSITSSSFANAISGLRTLDLVHGPNGGDLSIADVFLE